MADIKWIKITTDIFSDEKIMLIEEMPEADTILVIWFKLLCMAGRDNNNGIFLMNNKIPYTEEMFSTIFRRPLNTVRLAIATFEAFGMIEIMDGVFTLPNWEKHQNIDGMEKIREQTRLRVAKHREKQKQLACNVTVTCGNATDKEEDKEKDKEKDKDKEEDKNKPKYQQIVDMYNETCISFPKVMVLSEKRKKAIRARLKKYSIEDIEQAFLMAEESDFLKGNNKNNWSATFDWLMNDQNMAKVLEGNYRNKEQFNESKNSRDNYIDMWRNA